MCGESWDSEGISALPGGSQNCASRVREYSAFVDVLHLDPHLCIEPDERLDDEAISRLFECSWSQGLSAYRQRMKLIAEHDLRPHLHRIKIPVTLVASARDKLVPSLKEAYIMASLLPSSRVVVLPDHGHMPLVADGFSLAAILSPIRA